jgi:predicted RNA-binding protein with PIN domain
MNKVAELSDISPTSMIKMPDTSVNARDVFGVDVNMMVPAFSLRTEHVPELDPTYQFDRETTLAICAGFAHNRRVMVQGYHGTGKSTHIEQVAARLNWPCIRVNLDSHISRIDLIGKDATKTIVVFDAARAPDGLPGRYTHKGLRVWFAREYPDADSLIEELIDEDNAPASLVVVSSDRRLQAAARRRRADAVGCDEWLAEMKAKRRQAAEPLDAKPAEPGPHDVEAWKKYFGF